MKQCIKIVSYYTKNTPYEKESQHLIDSCKKFKLDYDVVGVDNVGSWSANCCLKPTFLLSKLEEYNCPLVWTDCDSVFKNYPVLFDSCKADIGMRINDQLPNDNKAKILTGTLFVNNTPSAKKLLELWAKKCESALKKESFVFDQVCLRKVVLHYPTIVEIRRLPVSYLYIVDNPYDRSNLYEDSVIVHYQASRIYQKVIDGELASSFIDQYSPEELKKIRTNK